MTKPFRMGVFAAVVSAAVLFVLIISSTAGLSSELKIMKKSELKPGMKGVARTVFKGTRIQEFPVAVIGVVPGGGPSGGDLILVRVSGKLIAASGGVAMGMSGSPVYIKGKLIGAVSVMFPDADHTIGGVTPIEDMISGYDYLEQKTGAAIVPPVKINGKTYTKIEYSKSGDAPGVLRARAAYAPVAIRGLNKRSYGVMKTFFAAGGLDVLPLVGGAAISEPRKDYINDYGSGKALKPGSSVAVQLVRGDMDISVVGTLTALDGGRALMFGHPMFTKGKIDYMLADASVLAIVNDPNAPYKLTTTGTCRGSVLQDRGSALIGYIDRFPAMIPMKVTVLDKDINREKTMSVSLVKDTDLFPNLVVAVMLNTLDKSIDRIGPGSASFSFTIETKGLDAKIERRNMFYSGFDITAESLRELMMALEIIQANYFKEVEIVGLEAKVEVDSKHSTASIFDAELFNNENKGEAAPASTDETAGGSSAEGDGSVIINEMDGEDSNVELPDILAEDVDSETAGRDAKSGSKSKAKTAKVRPGEKLCVKVKLIPYKKDPVEEKIYIKVPKDMASGSAVIDIFSGMKHQRPMGGLDASALANLILDQAKEKEREQGGESAGDFALDGKKKKNKTLEDIVNEFLDRDMNNELVATITSLSAAPGGKLSNEIDDSETNGLFASEEDEPPVKDRAKKSTGWVLTGSATIKVRIEGGADSVAGSSKGGKIEKSKISIIKKNEETNGGKQKKSR